MDANEFIFTCSNSDTGSTDMLDLIALKKVTAGTKDKNFMCDLNGDCSVTAADLAVCRKVLLSR